MFLDIKNYFCKLPAGLISVFAGLCLGAGFIYPWLAPLVVLGIIINFSFIISDNSTKKIIGLITLSWLIKYLFSVWYFWSTFPLDFMEAANVPLELAIIGFYWLTCSLWLSLGGTIFAGLAIFLNKKTSHKKRIWFFSLPFFWLAGEYFGAVSFSIFTLGPGSVIQDYFSFGMVGYLMTYTRGTLNLAQVSGIYGLTFILVGIVTFLFYSLVTKKSLIWWGIQLIFWLILLLNNQTFPYINKHTVVYVIDTEYTSDMYKGGSLELARIEDLNTAVDTALNDRPDFILLPEDARYLRYKYEGFDNNQILNYYKFTHSNSSTVLIDSNRFELETGETVLRANILDTKTSKIYNFDKQYLVPQGEYIPYIYGLIMRVLGYGSLVDKVAIDSAYKIGQETKNKNVPDYLPGILFCFESVRRDAVSNLINNKTIPFVAHLVSHDWFKGSWSLGRELDTMIRVQAVNNHVPIISASNMSEGKLYLPSGEIEQGEVVKNSNLHTIRKFEF